MPGWLIIKQDRTVAVATSSFRLMAVSGHMREMTAMHVGNALLQVGVAVLMISSGRCNQQSQGSECNSGFHDLLLLFN